MLSLVVAVVMLAGQAQAEERISRQAVTCRAGTTCIQLTNCPRLLSFLNFPTPQNIQILRNNFCGFSGRIPSVIRLGEHNLVTEEDCTTTGSTQRCAPPVQSFTPEQIIRHPDFDRRSSVSDDIALIRLDRAATFSTYVQPICIPPAGFDISTFLGGREVTVAGWGSTERGPDTQVLQKVLIPFVGKEECNPHYDNSLVNEQICFGGSGQRDACFGDSGGPVFATALGTGRFSLLAVVSFGQPSCGVPGVPAVYTDVASYRTWIVNNLRP
ncbi:clip domain serine proteinase [Penaeus vannamei]|uniref:CLIP domain-containing serine protease n=1 Tax=Penaeus vannamei TaxID=6689 RepID=A0A3R7MKW0_PENVA|nr:clip domain serine proteinase [Penaeus vannamei]